MTWLFGLAVMTVSFGAYAAQPYEYDPKVFAFLPEWCKYTALYAPVVPKNVRGPDAQGERERWNRIMGPQNFKHLHHYCRGLFLATRGVYFETDKTARDFAFSTSILEFDYVLERVEPTFPLLPEILTKKGESLARLRRNDAIAPLHRAINLKPDYWPAYAALSDYFKDIGNLGEARQWLQKGLSAAPKAQALERRLAEIDKSARKASGK
jgi:tetratricopeptide (TPR) repeat protein